MNGSPTLVLAVVFLFAFASAGVAGQALAEQPQSGAFSDSFSRVFENCDDFNTLEHVRLSGKDTVYFDRDGHAIRHVLRLLMDSTLTNSETGVVIGSGRAAVAIDEGLSNEDATNEGPRPGTTRFIGLDLQIKIDAKVVATEAGQVFIDIHDHDNPFDDEVQLEAGRHDLADGFDICAAAA